MDIREIDSINEKFNAIVCGFCIPYLSQTDCLKLITDCKNLLNDAGVLYLSFVAGNYENSSFISASSGERTYFYYHNLDYLQHVLKANSFVTSDLLLKNYKKTDGTEDIHTVLILKKLT